MFTTNNNTQETKQNIEISFDYIKENCKTISDLIKLESEVLK